MTLVHAPSPGAPGEGTRDAGRSAASRCARCGRAVWYVVSRTTLILAVALLGIGGWLGVGSRLLYDRVQHDDLATFRTELAQATAPTGPFQPGSRSKLLAPGTPVAVLTIPQIGLNAVVPEGTTGQVLEGGPGHLRDTPLPGQRGISVILGRRAAFGGPFARVSSLKAGAIFTVTTGQGVSRYRVLDVRPPGDSALPVPAGAARLILVTANGYPFVPTGVLQIDANLMSAPKAALTTAMPAADLSSSEQALGVDRAARVSIVLWGEALVRAAVGLSWLGARWGRWQARIVAIPVLVCLGAAVVDQMARLLPNLL
jgi:sortase A